MPTESWDVAVTVPCFNGERYVARLILSVPASAHTIFVVDDASADGTRGMREALRNPRPVLVAHDKTQRVGGAVISRHREVLARHAYICVKMYDDGQMSPKHPPSGVACVVTGHVICDEGSRFGDIRGLARMWKHRPAGNRFGVFFVNLVSAFWSILDPTNGHRAIRCAVSEQMNFRRLARGLFFKTKLPFEPNILVAFLIAMGFQWPLTALVADRFYPPGGTA